MKIYVVMGTTGDYSDRCEWAVCAYRDRATAEKHETMAMLRARDFITQYEDDSAFTRHMGALDPNGERRSNRTDYFTLEVELRDALP